MQRLQTWEFDAYRLNLRPLATYLKFKFKTGTLVESSRVVMGLSIIMHKSKTLAIASLALATLIKMKNPTQELPASFKAPNCNIEDMDVLSTLKFKIES